MQRFQQHSEKWRTLAPRERRILLQLVILLPIVAAALQLFGFNRTHDLLARHTPSSSPKPTNSATISDTTHHIARLVGIAAHHGPYHANCLPQSLALWWLLRRCGITTELRIGVRKDKGELQAHAWVEYQNRPINDVAEVTTRYAAFAGKGVRPLL